MDARRAAKKRTNEEWIRALRGASAPEVQAAAFAAAEAAEKAVLVVDKNAFAEAAAAAHRARRAILAAAEQEQQAAIEVLTPFLRRLAQKRLLRERDTLFWLQSVDIEAMAEDAQQEALIRLLRPKTLDGFRGECQFTSFAGAVVFGVIRARLDRAETRQRRVEGSENDEDLPHDLQDPQRSPEEQVILEDAVRGCLHSALTDDEREILVMRYIEGYSAKEVGEKTAKSQDAINSTVSRACKKLIICMQRKGLGKGSP